MCQIEVNKKLIQAVEGETILSALGHAGIKVPTLCHLEGLDAVGACRICVVEIAGFKNLVPACSYPVSEGMQISTYSPRAIEARKTIVELLLSNHPDDCLYCVRNETCSLSSLAKEYGIRERRFQGKKLKKNMDTASPAIVRDPEKCILCGKCVRVCDEIQTVHAIDFINRGSKAEIGCAFQSGLNVSSCINCGQCILVCPTGALTEKNYIKQVVEAIQNPKKIVVAQHAPSISVSLAEEFGLPRGTDVNGILVTVLRMLGFDYVFDTSFSADLTIMEEASELVHRIQHNGALPLLTSCSPGWVKFVEQFYPEFMKNLSSCKSPQQMLGAVTKTYFAEKWNLDPFQLVQVSLMPCTAKKFEAQRVELSSNGMADVDYVLTTRELVSLIKNFDIDIRNLEPGTADNPFGKRSTAGKLFGASGGVMEAALRTAYYLLEQKPLDRYLFKELRGSAGVKEMTIPIGDQKIGVAVVNGLKNARKLLEQIKEGRDDLHFVEVMTCPNGCIAGGGQPYSTDKNSIKERMNTLYRIDAEEKIKFSYENEDVQTLYREYLGSPLSEMSHKILHTKYQQRNVLL